MADSDIESDAVREDLSSMSLSETEMGLLPWEQMLRNDPSFAALSDPNNSSILSDVEQQDSFSDGNISEDKQLSSKSNSGNDGSRKPTNTQPLYSNEEKKKDKKFGASPSSHVYDVPRSRGSTRKPLENKPTEVHIYQATNVVVGERSKMIVNNISKKVDDSKDSKN